MFVSEDGTVTGSVDVSKLDEIDPKTDEAKAQIAALKAEAGIEQPEPKKETTPKSAAEKSSSTAHKAPHSSGKE
jgi:sRNA-binding protein